MFLLIQRVFLPLACWLHVIGHCPPFLTLSATFLWACSQCLFDTIATTSVDSESSSIVQVTLTSKHQSIYNGVRLIHSWADVEVSSGWDSQNLEQFRMWERNFWFSNVDCRSDCESLKSHINEHARELESLQSQLLQWQPNFEHSQIVEWFSTFVTKLNYCKMGMSILREGQPH
jgi:hypothetical protein